MDRPNRTPKTGDPRDWIHGDETAHDFLSRVLSEREVLFVSERPSLLLPPLHRVGNVVGIVGPWPSAKSDILLQAAINCILPKECEGVHFGGLERMVMYFDNDCLFDELRLSNVLKLRIMEACGLLESGLLRTWQVSELQEGKGKRFYIVITCLQPVTFDPKDIHLGLSGKNHESCPTYTSEWVQPLLNILDEFTVKDTICSLLGGFAAFLSSSRYTTEKNMMHHLHSLPGVDSNRHQV